MWAAEVGELGRLAWWQARAFTAKMRWPVVAGVCAWVNFYVDGLIRWVSGSIWCNDDAVVAAAHRRPVPWRAVVLGVGGLVVFGVVVFGAVYPLGSMIVGVVLGVGLIWSIGGLMVMLAAPPAGRETREARRVLRRGHHGSAEIINVARAPQGRGGAARDLMGQVADLVAAEGREVVCIARSGWHLGYYAEGGWGSVEGLLCSWTVTAKQ